MHTKSKLANWAFEMSVHINCQRLVTPYADWIFGSPATPKVNITVMAPKKKLKPPVEETADKKPEGLTASEKMKQKMIDFMWVTGCCESCALTLVTCTAGKT